MIRKIFYLIAIVLIMGANGFGDKSGDKKMDANDNNQCEKVIFASFAESEEQLDHILILAQSIRKFGGNFQNAPIILFVADYVNFDSANIAQKFSLVNVEILNSSAPKEALWFYYAGKTFAAGLAEKEAAERGAILVWMDDDTVLLNEPIEFILDSSINLAYRPVMHNRSGIVFGETPNPFWKRIYALLHINKESIFPLVTPADKVEINCYFNSGLLVVRPEKGILKKWSEDFALLYSDSALKQMCIDNVENRIFLHQTALVGAVLNTIQKNDMVELSRKYNYPLFFDQMFGAKEPFENISDIVTMRYEFYFQNPDPEWSQKLTGPQDKIAWLVEYLGK
ncbi:MAG: hypothetical protein ABIJ45_09450 [Candidatus Zixiibacteriota bacterium]